MVCEHVEHYYDQRMCVILCAKGYVIVEACKRMLIVVHRYALDRVTSNHLRELANSTPIAGYLPTFVVCLEKGY